ncbi:hypothetical protein ScPMuIL_001652 [Solemya velum]
MGTNAVDTEMNNYDNDAYQVDEVAKNDSCCQKRPNGPEKKQSEVVIEPEEWILYGVTDTPPMSVIIIGGFQHLLLSMAAAVITSFLVADVVCADNNLYLKNKLLGASLFMNGVTTLLSSLIGIRLPLIQAAAADFVVPLMSMVSLDAGHCKLPQPINITLSMNETDLMNTTLTNSIEGSYEELILKNVRELQGSLMLAGVLHILIGATGLVGLLLRFIGPITVVPAIVLLGIFLTSAIVKFNAPHWGIGLFTCAVSLILSLYLRSWKPPLPAWNREKGFHVIRYPVHQIFSILIAMLLGWAISAIITVSGGFSDDPKHPSYRARTDAQIEVMYEADWFHFPYPGQFGPISFSVSAFIGFLIAIITSIIDSIGDYYACASTCRVPPPPKHDVNRGIAVEGICCLISGVLGCGHATTTYGGNVGGMGITRVTSRKVFIAAAIMYLIIGVIGKFSAVFIMIPSPVLGGALLTMLGMFLGVVLSNLKHVDMDSSRNMAIIGTSIFVGLSIPEWLKTTANVINTGSPEADQILTMILVNPVLSGGILACFLDNTIPGSEEERGMTFWKEMHVIDSKTKFRNGYEVYDLWMPKILRQSRIRNWMPFLPDLETEKPIPRK